jgi:hypothetical protein
MARTVFVDEDIILKPRTNGQPNSFLKREATMPRETKSLLNLKFISIIIALIFSGFISFTPFQEIPSVFALGSEDPGIAAAALEEDDSDSDLVVAEDEAVPSAGRMGLSSSSKVAPDPQSASRFAAFNARNQNRWNASFDKKNGRVKLLSGGPSKRYEIGPEAVAMGFLKDAYMILGLKEDLSDIRTEKVDQTPLRNHVRFRQTHRGTPIMGGQVLVHSNPEGQVTMVQNETLQDIQPANEDRISEAVAIKVAQDDLHATQGQGIVLSTARAEKWVAPHKGNYFYVWKVTVPTRNPWGLWVYHVNAETGEVIYKGNEIQSLRTGKGRGYKSNLNWHNGIISNLSLKYMYSPEEGNTGYLIGAHADVYDNQENDPWSPDFSFLYDPFSEKDWFDAVQAYYQMNTTWEWWNKTVLRKYGPLYPDEVYDYFYDLSTPVYVNLPECNAYYSSDIVGEGYPGFAFGNENSCFPIYGFNNQDLVIDNDVVRHEYAHAMMDWCGFGGQFGGPMHYYGRSMGEGNSDWFSYLYSKDPEVADVGWFWSTDGYLRNLDNTRMYPYDVDHPSLGLPEEHYTGEIWGGYLYDLSRVLKTKALPYIYQSFFYFLPSGGHMDGYPDFFDAILAQHEAEWDLTGKETNTAKAWGSWTGRGINGLRRPAYSSTNYFRSGSSGSDDGDYLYWMFPPEKTLITKANLLMTGDGHEYIIQNNAETPLNLSVSVTSTAGGLVNPYISLSSYDTGTGSSDLLSSVVPISLNKAVLTYPALPPGFYVVEVTGQATSPARGYYNFKVTFK